MKMIKVEAKLLLEVAIHLMDLDEVLDLEAIDNNENITKVLQMLKPLNMKKDLDFYGIKNELYRLLRDI